MNFDDYYMLNLSIRLSDFENTQKFYKNLKNKNLLNNNEEILINLSTFCKNPEIFKLFIQNKHIDFSDSKDNDVNKSTNTKNNLVLNLFSNPFNNVNAIKFLLNVNKNDKGNLKNKLNLNLNFIKDENKSVLISVAKNSNITKKLNSYNLLLTNMLNYNPNFLIKNSKGETQAQILSSEDPVNIDTVFIEKLEKLKKFENSENKFLFSKNYVPDLKSTDIDIKENICNYIKEPSESYKIGFADIEFKLLLLNLKLRKMYEININNLHNHKSDAGHLTKLHFNLLDEFIFEKLLLDKI
jgi:hypothetical protein